MRGRQEVDFEDEDFARLSLAAIPQMTPELARIVSIFHLPRKPDARCGRLPTRGPNGGRGADSTIFPPGMQTICIPPARGKPSTVRPTSKREVGGTQVSSTASRSNVCEILLVSSIQEHRTHMVPLVPRKMASTVILEPPDFNLTTLPVLISFAIVSRPSQIAEGHGNAVGRLNCHVGKAYSR